MKFAEDTTVTTERSRAEIESLVKRYKGDSFGSMWEGDRAAIMFRMKDRTVRFSIARPKASDFMTTAGGRRRNEAAAECAADQEERRRWRALALAVKAKLEMVASGIVDFEQEFLAFIVLPDGSTVGNRVREEVRKAYVTGGTPKLLLGAGA